MIQSKDTKNRILDAAEELFATEGFEKASLRDITREAGVNLASVNYHFQSKEALTDAVTARALGPVNEKRLAMLHAAELEANGQPIAIEKIVEAFVRPVLEESSSPSFQRLLGRAFTAPDDFIERLFRTHLMHVALRFNQALAETLPDLSIEDRMWRIQFMAGAMSHTIAWMRVIPKVTGGVCSVDDLPRLTQRIVEFVSAGMLSGNSRKKAA